MCGLIGALLNPHPRSLKDLSEILSITTENLLGNEERGYEATGIAVIQSDGRHWICKHPVPATSLVGMSAYTEMLSHVDEQTVCILGHTRMPTKGSRWHSPNNHPILAGEIIGVHNGVIENDDALFDQWQFPRSGQVDSEIIFRLQGLVEPRVAHPAYATALQGQIQGLQGCFATLSVDIRQPARLVVLKHMRPLCLHYEPTLDVLFFSSRYAFLRRAFGRAVSTEAIDSGFGYCFDAGRIQDLGSEPVDRFPLLLDQPIHEAV